MNRTNISGGFWLDRLQVNAQQAIFHQWDQLVSAGCIENFRIAAGETEGFREGWFFADSDAYKWLEAAARIQAAFPNERLAALIDDLIALVGRAQMADGYIFTYNQIHFPDTRWQNLQIEHELYCHGHLIEAAVSHYEVSGRSDLLEIARRAADRIVADFLGKGPGYTPGHEEIEIALLRLHRVIAGDSVYLAMARQFIEQRGRSPLFALSILRQHLEAGKRTKWVAEQKRDYMAAHPQFKPFQLPPGNVAKKPANSMLRWYASALSGKYFQQHAPIRRQIAPVGHSVRFAYFVTAVTMLARASGDRSLLPALESLWQRMVTRRMYLTGGIGSLPGTEGFGNDYELDPEFAYAETCAALASLFWNWQMVQLTGEAKYSDLFEWQLYNAAGVGMGFDGRSYLYNNPLTCRGGVERKPWYAVPCCPSNISRTWADLGRYIVSSQGRTVRIHQFISSHLSVAINDDNGAAAQVSLDMESGLPWEDWVCIKVTAIQQTRPGQALPFQLEFRQPAWAQDISVTVNGEPLQMPAAPAANQSVGYDPRPASFRSISRHWTPGDQVEIVFPMKIELRRAHPRVKAHQDKVAVTRGPLVYCLESVDNPGIDIFTEKLDPASLVAGFDPALLGGMVKITAKTSNGQPLTLIPYFAWGNRAASQMTVWVCNPSSPGPSPKGRREL